MENLRYPIGRFDLSRQKESVDWHIWMLSETPNRLRDAVSGLTPEQLNTPYRPGGWTVRQVVHHLPDSHLNGYLRFKLALTENRPTIQPYNQDRWAKLSDTADIPVEVSVQFLDTLHQRWVGLLQTMRPEQFQKGYVHPDEGFLSLEKALRHYSWHSRHHLAQILTLRERMNW
ncbi:DinB family protein [Melghirimyces profundicolus]|uniref:DinB family protein n=1 Tax=Melghirimyces profundicolus TaxID=1242148 RepID=A0A2T6BGE2_9BACL|nr:putative metal-dependent hydrolase [Melghirimyces profundicolus]PTX55127.1 DinB family protein [Melghirimyces profundicolus]